MDPDSSPTTPPPSPPIWRWVIGFLMVGMCWGLVSFPPKAKQNQIKAPSQKRTNSLTIPPPFYFPFFPIDNPLYAQSRRPSRLSKIPTIPPHQFEFKQQEYLLLAKKKTFSNLVCSEGFTAKSQICDSVALECHGECMVFFVDWAGWYVIIIFFPFFFFLSSLHLLFLFLSFGGGFVEPDTSKNKKS